MNPWLPRTCNRRLRDACPPGCRRWNDPTFPFCGCDYRCAECGAEHYLYHPEDGHLVMLVPLELNGTLTPLCELCQRRVQGDLFEGVAA